MCHKLLANPLIESYEIELRRPAAAPGRGRHLPRVAGRPGRAPALDALGAEPCPSGTPTRSCRTSARSCCPAASPTATTCGPGRSRASRRRWRRLPGSPATADWCSGSATASRSSARPGCYPASCGATSRSRFVCRDIPRPRRADGHAVHLALRCGAAPRHPGQARGGLLVRGRELLAELEQHGQILLRYDGDNPNGSLAAAPE